MSHTSIRSKRRPPETPGPRYPGRPVPLIGAIEGWLRRGQIGRAADTEMGRFTGARV